MNNLLDKIDTWKKLFSLLAVVASAAFSIGIYSENWYKIGINMKMPYINENENVRYVQKFSLNSGFAAFPLIESIAANEITFKIYYYTTHPGEAYVGYNFGAGTQNTQRVPIKTGIQVVSNFVFNKLKCNTTYEFFPGFVNENATLFGNTFLVEAGPCISGKLVK